MDPLALRPRRDYISPMSFVSRFNPKTGIADFWTEFRKPNPWRWPILFVSTMPLMVIYYWLSGEVYYRTPERPTITYISTLDEARTDAEIAASNAANQEVTDLRKAAEEDLAQRKKDIYKALGKGIGMDVEKIDAEAQARRAAEAAAEADRRARILADSQAGNPAPSSAQPTIRDQSRDAP